MNEPVTVTYDLADILKELKQDIKDVNTKLEKLNIIEVKLATIETELKGVNKRLDSQEFINRSVAVGFILAFITGVIKLFFPNFPNIPHQSFRMATTPPFYSQIQVLKMYNQ
jgi:hypothetical protein